MFSESELGAKEDHVLRRTRAARVAIEHRALERRVVLDVGRRIPVGCDREGLRFAARAGCREARREGILIDGDRRVARQELPRSPLAVRGIARGNKNVSIVLPHRNNHIKPGYTPGKK